MWTIGLDKSHNVNNEQMCVDAWRSSTVDNDGQTEKNIFFISIFLEPLSLTR